MTHVGYVSFMTPFSINQCYLLPALWYYDKPTAFLDKYLRLCAGTLFLVYFTQWFVTISSATEMTKIGQNNLSFLTVYNNYIACKI